MLLTAAVAVAASAATVVTTRCSSVSSSLLFYLAHAIAVDIVTYFCSLRLSLSFLAELIHLLLF